MWLPRDERALLLAHYIRLMRYGVELPFAFTSWNDVMAASSNRLFWGHTIRTKAARVPDWDYMWDWCMGEGDSVDVPTAVADVGLIQRVDSARRKLADWGLITVRVSITPAPPGASRRRYSEHHYVSLTQDGDALARRYNSWFWRSNEYWKEIRGHWLVTFLIGIGAGLLLPMAPRILLQGESPVSVPQPTAAPHTPTAPADSSSAPARQTAPHPPTPNTTALTRSDDRPGADAVAPAP